MASEIGCNKLMNKILTGFVYFFSYFLFPSLIIFSLLDRQYEISTTLKRNQAQEKMKNKLEYVEKYSTNSRYFHFLLTEISNIANKSPEPLKYLKPAINNIRQNYPNIMEFIVWDESGEVVRDLTDKKTFYYAMKRVYEILKEVVATISDDPKSNISALASVSSNINIIRQLLGKIIIPDHLRKPYLRGEDAGPILTDLGGQYSYVWYRLGSKVSFMCFFSRAITESNFTLKNIIKALNNKELAYVCGYSTSDDYSEPKTKIPIEYKNSLKMALAKFEKSGESFYEDDEILALLTMPQPELRAFCIYPKEEKIWSREVKHTTKFYQIMVLLFILYATIYLTINFRSTFVSISWKVTFIFMLANLIPLSILGFIAYDYLNVAQETIYEETKSNLSRKLRDFDSRFESLKYEFSYKLNEKLDQINKENKANTLSDESVEEIGSFAASFEPSELALFASDSKQLYAYRDISKHQKIDLSFYKAFAKAILNYSNGFPFEPSEDMFSKILDPENSDVVRKSFTNVRQVKTMNMGSSERLSYTFMIGEKETYKNNYLLYMSWDENRFQQLYVDRYYIKNAGDDKNIQFYTASLDGRHRKSPSKTFSPVLLKHMETLNSFSESKTLPVRIGMNYYLTVISRGINLNNILLAATYPMEKLKDRVDNLRDFILMCAFISMILTIVLGQVLINQFITPINNLRQGTIAVGNQQYTHRIPITDEDEFGHVNQVFNRVIEGLADFEMAKVVQESLLPGNQFKLENLSVYAQNIVMTTLGGDYYDVVKINEGKWGVLIGDVAGHGVGAGLMMAMAKAGVITASEEEKSDPSLLTTRLHKMFFAIKNDRLKRMMTFQYFTVEPHKNAFCFANAGHCFPIIVDPKNNSAEFVEHIGTPLGIGPRARYKNLDFVLERGLSLILYTDGIAEAKNEEGEEYTFERLKRVLPRLYDRNPEKFYNNIYAEYDEWSAKPDDDFTVMVINNE